MKIIWLFVLLVCGFSGILLYQQPRRDDEWPPKQFLAMMKPIVETCRQQTGVKEMAIKEFSDGEIHDDETLKCYMNCLFQEFDVVDDNGDVHLETLFRTVPDNIREVLLIMSKGCIHPEGDTLCDKAWWFNKCWKMADPMHYFLP